MVMAPIVRGRKGEFKKEMETLVKHGYTRARIDGELVSLDDETEISLDKRKNHTIEVVIDRLLVKPGIEHRLEMSVGLAMKLAGGLVRSRWSEAKSSFIPRSWRVRIAASTCRNLSRGRFRLTACMERVRSATGWAVSMISIRRR